MCIYGIFCGEDGKIKDRDVVGWLNLDIIVLIGGVIFKVKFFRVII